MANGEEPSTEELRLSQARREAGERQEAEAADLEDEAKQHARRAEKSEYLKEKLEERAESEREAAEED